MYEAPFNGQNPKHIDFDLPLDQLTSPTQESLINLFELVYNKTEQGILIEEGPERILKTYRLPNGNLTVTKYNYNEPDDTEEVILGRVNYVETKEPYNGYFVSSTTNYLIIEANNDLSLEKYSHVFDPDNVDDEFKRVALGGAASLAEIRKYHSESREQGLSFVSESEASSLSTLLSGITNYKPKPIYKSLHDEFEPAPKPVDGQPFPFGDISIADTFFATEALNALQGCDAETFAMILSRLRDDGLKNASDFVQDSHAKKSLNDLAEIWSSASKDRITSAQIARLSIFTAVGVSSKGLLPPVENDMTDVIHSWLAAPATEINYLYGQAWETMQTQHPNVYGVMKNLRDSIITNLGYADNVEMQELICASIAVPYLLSSGSALIKKVDMDNELAQLLTEGEES